MQGQLRAIATTGVPVRHHGNQLRLIIPVYSLPILICMYVDIYIYTYKYTQIYIFTHTNIHKYIYLHIQIYIYTYMEVQNIFSLLLGHSV